MEGEEEERWRERRGGEDVTRDLRGEGRKEERRGRGEGVREERRKQGPSRKPFNHQIHYELTREALPTAPV